MSGTLYICGTPIGNLEDITIRVLNTLKEVDLIACEDTRHTIKLLNHYDIKTKMTSYHEHNKQTKGEELIKEIAGGKNIALVTDAGMPGISDPGSDLVKLCLQNGIPVTCCPGATAQVTGLVLSGISARRYAFEGFLPRDKKERKEVLQSLTSEYRTTVFYEAPHHLTTTLSDLLKALGDRKAATVREITKKHEAILTGTLSFLLDHFTQTEPLGEFVIILEGADKEQAVKDAQDKWLEISFTEHLEIYLQKGASKKEAMKLVAADRGIPKREVYAQLLVDES